MTVAIQYMGHTPKKLESGKKYAVVEHTVKVPEMIMRESYTKHTNQIKRPYQRQLIGLTIFTLKTKGHDNANSRTMLLHTRSFTNPFLHIKKQTQ